VVVLTKRDLLPADHPLPDLVAPDAHGVCAVSSVAGLGIEELKEYLWKLVEQVKASAVSSDVGPGKEGDEL
jgi:hypothetical protein